MKCKHAQEQLIQRFDEETLVRLSMELQVHINQCEKCVRTLEQLLKLQEGLFCLPKPEPVETFWINFLPKLNWKLEGRSTRRQDIAWIPSLAAAIIFAIFLLKTPVLMAPPGWIHNLSTTEIKSNYYGILNENLSAQETERLDTALKQEDIQNKYLGAEGAAVTINFSQNSDYQPDDIIDQLAKLDDDAINVIIGTVQKKSVIRSKS